MRLLDNFALCGKPRLGTRVSAPVSKSAFLRRAILAFVSVLTIAEPALATEEKAIATTQMEIVEPTGITVMQHTGSSSDVRVEFASRKSEAVSLAVPDAVEVTSEFKDPLSISVNKPVVGVAGGGWSMKIGAALPPSRVQRPGSYSGNMIVVAQYN